jgi:hypothetical protein
MHSHLQHIDLRSLSHLSFSDSIVSGCASLWLALLRLQPPPRQTEWKKTDGLRITGDNEQRTEGMLLSCRNYSKFSVPTVPQLLLGRDSSMGLSALSAGHTALARTQMQSTLILCQRSGLK